jgi:hypothetical protein
LFADADRCTVFCQLGVCACARVYSFFFKFFYMCAIDIVQHTHLASRLGWDESLARASWGASPIKHLEVAHGLRPRPLQLMAWFAQVSRVVSRRYRAGIAGSIADIAGFAERFRGVRTTGYRKVSQGITRGITGVNYTGTVGTGYMRSRGHALYRRKLRRAVGVGRYLRRFGASRRGGSSCFIGSPASPKP